MSSAQADAAATPQRKLEKVFNNTPGDLHGGCPLTPDKVIFWPNFLHVDGIPPPAKRTWRETRRVSRPT